VKDSEWIADEYFGPVHKEVARTWQERRNATLPPPLLGAKAPRTNSDAKRIAPAPRSAAAFERSTFAASVTQTDRRNRPSRRRTVVL